MPADTAPALPAPLDTQFIGHRFAPFSAEVENGRLKFFAQAIGQTDPVYSDEAAARAAGHPALPVPPTFLFCLEMASPNPAALRELLGFEVPQVLHGEQRFTYHAMAYAGDTLHFEQRIANIYAKKGGLLEFIQRETRVTNQHGQHVADLHGITVVRHG
jgi:acyl dehydratase